MTITEELRSKKTLLITTEVMQIVRVGRNTLCKWVREGKIHATRKGNGYGYDPRLLADYLESREA